jgi:hypothetical protein
MKLTKDNYFDVKEKDGVPILSSSLIKNALPINGGNVSRIRAAYNKELDEVHTDAMSFGSLIHLYAEDASKMVLMPEWDISSSVKQILDEALELVTSVSEETPSEDLSNHETELMTVANSIEWRVKNKTEVRMKYLKEGEEYWKFIISNRDKVVVTGSEGERVKKVVEGIQRAGLETPLLKNDLNKEVHRELPIQFELSNGMPCKILIDLLEVDHKEKKAVITDLKTSSSKVEHFVTRYSYIIDDALQIRKQYSPGDYVKYRYFLQEYFYKLGLAKHMNTIGCGDYDIEFRFGVVETFPPYCSKMVYAYNEWDAIAELEFNQAMQVIHQWFKEDGFLTF